MLIRDEAASDLDAIREVHRAAFGGRVEADLVDLLRADGLPIWSGVAEERDEVVGHILFSPVWIGNDGQSIAVASLAPVGVRPTHQRRGIGSALIRAGLERCARDGWRAVIVVGDPPYYKRFGFSSAAVAHLQSPYGGDAFMGLELTAGSLTRVSGRVRYPAAFETLESAGE